MHGMVGIITEVMENEEIKKDDTKEFSNATKFKKILLMAMIVISTIIAIILVNLVIKKNAEEMKDFYSLNDRNIEVVECEDEKVIDFINSYFKARTNLNYQRIFLSFGRDYYKEEIEKKDDSFDNIIKLIRYERIFVKSYDNIRIYCADGYKKDELTCIVLYDMALGFTDVKAPMIAIFYLESVDDNLIIKNNIDVGTSKYLVEVANNEKVKELYEDTKRNLERAIISSESLRLSYNTLRQFEINQNIDMGTINKKEVIDSIVVKDLDPINDIDKIYDTIVREKEEKRAREQLENYLNKVIASLSELQR